MPTVIRGHREKIAENEGMCGNILNIIELLSLYRSFT